ncbi:MAG TPA: PIN domain-containing protein [Gaiellaceae bacterium]|nr:PIN domain-containing protein [Gaiellaceae bacterium]
MRLYLADSSIWIGARRNPGSYLPDLLADRVEDDAVATCVPVALEVLTGPPTAGELESEWRAVWQRLRWLAVTEAIMERALALLRGLAATTEGAHRRRPIDYIVAACSEAHEVVLWHWDDDFRVICDFAGIPHEAEHERAKAAGLALR